MVLGPPPPSFRLLCPGADRWASTATAGLEGRYHIGAEDFVAHFHGYLYDQVHRFPPTPREASRPDRYGCLQPGPTRRLRVPDGGVHRTLPETLYVPHGRRVIDDESPHDETWEKLQLTAPSEPWRRCWSFVLDRSAAWLVLDGNGYSRCRPQHVARLGQLPPGDQPQLAPRRALTRPRVLSHPPAFSSLPRC